MKKQESKIKKWNIRSNIVILKRKTNTKQIPTIKGKLHPNSWNLTFINKSQFPLILQSFVFNVSKNW